MIGALALVVLSAAAAVVFLAWRASAQHDVLTGRAGKCRAGDAAACDSLRTACLKRSPEACELLAGAYLAEKGPDPHEAVGLFEEACTYRGADGCFRAGSMVAAGQGVPKDASHARDLFTRGCSLGSADACAAKRKLGD